jgi:hypothetical protein
MKIGDKIRLINIHQSLFDIEATYTDPDHPNISEVLQQIIDKNTVLTITRKDDDGVFLYDYMFTDKDGEQGLYVFPVEGYADWEFV